jgi:hypothetical protein
VIDSYQADGTAGVSGVLATVPNELTFQQVEKKGKAKCEIFQISGDLCLLGGVCGGDVGEGRGRSVSRPTPPVPWTR